MLYRIGKKQRLAKKIIPYFPEHNIYIEPFFGAGGLFFNKPKAKCNLINDYNNDVYNLFMVLKNRNNEFLESFDNLPIDQSIFNYWNKIQETDPIQKALRFVLLSNFSYLGQANTFCLLPRDIKSLTINKISKVNELLQNVIISCLDFESFLNNIIFDNDKIKSESFIYADPPYENRSNNYDLNWKINDTARLFFVLSKMNIRFAISEIESEFTLYLANSFNLNINIIGDVRSLSSTRKEILITNY
jgi:DNA adenine methylase